MRAFSFCLSLLALGAAPALAQTAAPAVRVDVTAPGAAALAPAPMPDKSGYTFLTPPPTSALRSFSSDRPAKSNSPITVDAGHVQYETDLFNYTHFNAGGASTRSYAAFDPVLKAGITNWMDVEVQFTGYTWLQVRDPRTGARIQDARGAGDVIMRPKINLFGNEGGVAAAIIPYVKFPTAARSIGNGHTEGGVIVPVSIPAPLGFTAVIQPEVDVLRNAANAGHHFSYTQIINVAHPVGPKVTVYGEFYSALGTDAGTPPIYTLDAAVSYALTDTLQVDAGVNFGLNRASPNVQAYTGIAQRF